VLGGLGPFADSGAEAARFLLAVWDGDLGVESGPALLYACFQRALAAGLYRPVLGDRTWEWMASGVPAPTTTLVRRWLANDTWELLGGPTPDASVGAERSERVLGALPAALAAAWASATEHGGADPGLWRWGDVHQAARVHPLSEVGPLPGVPMGGDADTIQAAGYGWKAGSPFTVLSLSVYRQVVDLASPDTASWVIPGGASGDPESPHFADQLADWAEHRRIPMIVRDSASESGANPAR
jgi:penicillin amidase